MRTRWIDGKQFTNLIITFHARGARSCASSASDEKFVGDGVLQGHAWLELSFDQMLIVLWGKLPKKLAVNRSSFLSLDGFLPPKK